MSYANHDRARAMSRRGIAVAVVASLGFALPHSASAQIGGLARRAKDKLVAQQVDARTNTVVASRNDAAPTFDDVTLELTSDRVAQIIRGLTAGRAVLDGANGSPSRASLVARRDEAARKSAALSQENSKAIEAYNTKRDANQRCRNDAISASRSKRQAGADQRNKELQAKAMADPEFRAKTMAVMQKVALAQQKGDTAEVKRLIAALGVAADDPKPDSIAADKACGGEPPKPAAMAQIEQLDAQANTLSDDIRKLEEQSAATEVKDSRLTERQFLMARERTEAYLSAMKYKSPPRGFSPAELEALGARRADLEKVM
jgi:hypothetical protein